MRSWIFRVSTFTSLRYFMYSFSHLGFFPDGSGIMMSACKARGLGEVSRGDSLPGQSSSQRGIFLFIMMNQQNFSKISIICSRRTPEPATSIVIIREFDSGSQNSLNNKENEKSQKFMKFLNFLHHVVQGELFEIFNFLLPEDV